MRHIKPKLYHQALHESHGIVKIDSKISFNSIVRCTPRFSRRFTAKP